VRERPGKAVDPDHNQEISPVAPLDETVTT
jgi:hypothetical protein